MSQARQPDYTALDLPAAPDDRPYVLINMVMSSDGKVVIEGTEKGLGSSTDQRLMRELRVNADLTLNGANTLRASGTSSRVPPDLQELRVQRGLPENPGAAVITRSADLPLEIRFFNAFDFDAVIYVCDAAPPDLIDAIRDTGRPVVLVPAGDEVRAMLRHMRHERDAKVLLVEGGPILNGELIRLDAVDEYFLTLSPTVVGGTRGLTPVESAVVPSLDRTTRLQLVSAVTNPATNEIYCRYRIVR